MRVQALAVAVPVLAAGAVAFVGSFAGSDLPASPKADPTPRDIARGETLYAENCASCHGADLEGQPEWRSPGPEGRLPAPPHDDSGHTWHHPDSMLFAYTKFGGQATLAEQGVEFDSGMPAFENTLSDREIRDILAFIKSTWSPRARAVQAERTAADESSTEIRK